MAKGIIVGFLVGAVAGALLLTWLSPAPKNTSPAPPTPPTAPPAGALSPEEARSLQRALDDARAELESLRGDLAAARASGGTPPAVAPAKRRSWNSLQERIRAGLKSGWLRREDDPNTRELMIAALSLLHELAKETGVTVAEAIVSPDGWPALVAAFLAGAEPALTGEQRGALEAALAACGREWEALRAKRETMTGLELNQAADTIGTNFLEALRPALDKASEDALDDIQELVEDAEASRVLDWESCEMLPEEEVRKYWAVQWGDALGLEVEQRAKLGPILDAYIRDQDALEREVTAFESGGRPLDPSEIRERKIGLMTTAQRQILEGLDLSAAQAQALRDWTVVYERPSK